MEFNGEKESIRVNKNNRSKKSWIGLIAIVLIYIFLFSYSSFVNFKVGRIRIDDISYISSLVREDIVSNFSSELNLASIVKEVHSICENSPWASNCRVSFNLPDTINVEFEKVIPVAFLIEDDGKLSFLSRDGQKITTQVNVSKIYRFKERFSLPFVKIQSQRCSAEQIADFINYVRKKSPDFLDQVICSDFSLEIYSNEKYKVILPLDDLYGAFDRFLKMKNQIMNNATEVDARGKEGIFVK